MWVEQDGQVNPVDLCMAYAKGAKAKGVEIREHAGVLDIETQEQRVQRVVLENGEKIACSTVINCAGLWARHVGLMAGVNVPLKAVEHMYVVTESKRPLWMRICAASLLISARASTYPAKHKPWRRYTKWGQGRIFCRVSTPLAISKMHFTDLTSRITVALNNGKQRVS